LRRILRAYADYYNRIHTHLALGKDTPLGRPVQVAGSLTAIPLLGGLHHEYGRRASEGHPMVNMRDIESGKIRAMRELFGAD
jgi:hypothetical protein